VQGIRTENPVISTGAAECLDYNTSEAMFSSAIFQAEPANQGTIYIGDLNVTRQSGIALKPGDQLKIVGDFRRDGTDEFMLNTFFMIADAGDAVRIQLFQKRTSQNAQNI
jgi:hypothetical protein